MTYKLLQHLIFLAGLCIAAVSYGQSDLVIFENDITEDISSFEYICEGMIGEQNVEPKALEVLNFTQTKKNIKVEFIATTNCGEKGKGNIFINSDTLKIHNNS